LITLIIFDFNDFRVEDDLKKNLALQKIENVKLQNQISSIK